MHVVESSGGKVFLVGTGPGDPELITVKGLLCLQKASVIIHDRLVPLELLKQAGRKAEIIPVGKKGGHYSFPQEKINALLVSRARAGHQVVRLKGGDPYLFGRGGEEVLHLIENEVDFEVVPGVSSATAAPASAGIPLTHRKIASSVAFVTGHQCSAAENSVKWDLLAGATDTLVVLMPLQNLKGIVSRLVLAGRSLETPAAIVQSGTAEDQMEVRGTLRNIARRAAEQGIQSPALLIVGEVVQLNSVIKGLNGKISSGRVDCLQAPACGTDFSV